MCILRISLRIKTARKKKWTIVSLTGWISDHQFFWHGHNYFEVRAHAVCNEFFAFGPFVKMKNIQMILSANIELGQRSVWYLFFFFILLIVETIFFWNIPITFRLMAHFGFKMQIILAHRWKTQVFGVEWQMFKKKKRIITKKNTNNRKTVFRLLSTIWTMSIWKTNIRKGKKRFNLLAITL